MSGDSALEGWHRFIGGRQTEGAHPLLPGEAARGTQHTWRYWRDASAPDFSQRFTGTFSDDGNTITGRGELSRDGNTWEDDLALDYQRLAWAG